MGEDKDEIIITNEDCDELKEVAEEALDKYLEDPEWDELNDAMNREEECWMYLYLLDDIWPFGMPYEAYRDQVRACAEVHAEVLDKYEEWEQKKEDRNKAKAAWEKAEEKYHDCIHGLVQVID